jgi:hypothetical protein
MNTSTLKWTLTRMHSRHPHHPPRHLLTLHPKPNHTLHLQESPDLWAHL